MSDIVDQMREESGRIADEIERLRKIKAVYDNAVRRLVHTKSERRGRPTIEAVAKSEVLAVWEAAPSGRGMVECRERWPEKSERTLWRWISDARRQRVQQGDAS